jgi:serine/threonine protein phosphatase PrpC
MSTQQPSFRLTAATGIHRGDREYQQDQVLVLPHKRTQGCVMAVLADGMGGKSGGRKAADQVVLTARQLFEQFSPQQDDAIESLKALTKEAHLMIKLTAITSEEEPHSTLAAALVLPTLEAFTVHAGDSRVYHFRGKEMLFRTLDHSFVQRLVSEGQITEEEANSHPKSNLLIGCLGADQDPPIAVHQLENLKQGDTLLACSDGLWHYFTPKEIGTIIHDQPPREASEMLISIARRRARGGGDNLSVALIHIEGEENPTQRH